MIAPDRHRSASLRRRVPASQRKTLATAVPDRRKPCAVLRLAVALGFLAAIGCFGARPTLRSYYVLHGEPSQAISDTPLFRGLLRVRNLSAEAVYQKFQIVVRRSPYELRYSESNVWAVKPDQMVSDIIARRLAETRTFSSVTRELGDMRPDFTMGGELHAIEVYDSNDLWYAHLSLSLTLHRFSTGERLWSYSFDDRKLVPTTSFAHAVRAISELLETALRQGNAELSAIAGREAEPLGAPTADPDGGATVSPSPDDATPPPALRPKADRGSDEPPEIEKPIYVPEPTPP